MNHHKFMETLDSKMGMKNADWLQEQLDSGVKLILLDLRGVEAVKRGHIAGSKQVNFVDLPSRFEELIPSKESTVIVICNGSIQSAMAMMFLRLEGYEKSYNLSGGFSGWERNERPIVS